MKWILQLTLLIFLLSISLQTRADQLAWITEAQAKKAVEFLKKNKKVILYCACCDINEGKRKVKIKNITYRHPVMAGEEQTDYYQVFVTIKVDGEWKEIGLDLAYVHVKQSGKQAHCLGKVLNFECDPCTEPFAW